MKTTKATSQSSAPTWKLQTYAEGLRIALCWPILFRNKSGIYYGPLHGETVIRETPAGNFYLKIQAK